MDFIFEGKYHGEVQSLRLKGTERQWQLERQVTRKSNGSETECWEPFRFYSSLESALVSVASEQYRVASVESHYVARMKALAQRVEEEMIAPLKRALND